MKDPIVITIPGTPVPWARAAGGKTTKHFTPARQRSYMNSVRLFGRSAMRGRPPLDGPIMVKFMFVFAPTKVSQSGWKTSRADADNLQKIVADSLSKICWQDDSQLCHVTIYKMYGIEPKTEISFVPLNAPPVVLSLEQ